jgi:hypothetical protein
MLTRTLRRYSGSPQRGETRTASTSSAAAERKMAPTLQGAAIRWEHAKGMIVAVHAQTSSFISMRLSRARTGIGAG